MLDKEKVTKNFTRLVKIGKENGFITDELIEAIGEDWIKAPASGSSDFAGCYEGGLVNMALRIAKYAIHMNELLPEDKQLDKTSILKVCLLHSIGKTKLFTPQDSQWHKERGMLYKFNDDLVSYTVGERSLVYATSNGVKFTEEEAQAILFYGKGDDSQVKGYSTSLTKLLRGAIMLTDLEMN
jgi:hypothetical protein